MQSHSEQRGAQLIGENALHVLHQNGLRVVSKEEWSALQQDKIENELEIRRLKKELVRYARKLATWKTFGKSCS